MDLWSLSSCILVLFLVLVNDVRAHTKVLDVTKFGAVGDGKTDSGKAFWDAFHSACQYPGNSRVLVPRGTYLIGSTQFKGPCKGPINFKIHGVLRAPDGPTDAEFWIAFRYIDRLTIDGIGTLDARGETAWHYNDCSKNSNCRMLPISLRLDFVTNSWVQQITLLNGKNFQMNVFGCTNVRLRNLRILAPAESPNTDGIHLGHSEGIRISDSVIATGDDCISFGPGSKNVEVLRVKCGPGHGISIGSLGKYPDELDVSGIRVKHCVLSGTDNGLRIKTWATSLKSKVYNISYEDIVMKDVRNPIFIDQLYCPSGRCDNSRPSSVQIQDVWFKHIRGTSLSQAAVHLRCSSKYPCKNVNLRDIDLSYHGKEGAANATCSNIIGSASGIEKPELLGCV